MNTDLFSRKIDYLRVSVTDRCNLRCRYCMPDQGVDLLDHAEILSYEEILRVVRAGARMGIRKIRVTGGEPLVRRNICHLIEQIVQTPGIEDVGLTTNGVLLADMAQDLFDAGLRRINISLDTLDEGIFSQITRTRKHRAVMEGVARAEDVGFSPIKLNAVIMRGINDHEIEAFGRLSMEKPYAVRFIEYMPVGDANPWSDAQFISSREIRDRLSRLGPLIHIERSCFDGPSDRYKLDGAKGELGFISALSNHFCADCNRLRLTPEGRLRPCLLSDIEVDLKPAIRGKCSDADLTALIREAISKKPKQHMSVHHRDYSCHRDMFRIGG